MASPESPTYARRTILCAAAMLKALGHSGFDQFLLELDLPDKTAARGSGLMARATSLATFALNNPQQLSPDRLTIPAEIVRRATEIWNSRSDYNLSPEDRQKFEAALASEGLASSRLSPQTDNSVTLGGETDETGWTGASITLSGSSVEKLQEALSAKPHSSYPRRVFIVHGHDEGMRESVARLLEKLNFEVVILHEQAHRGRTLIEKFEENSNVGFVVVLLTPDDQAGKADEPPQRRARQNVLLEWGYFIGRLGRHRVCALRKGDLEMPSDIIGIGWQPFDEHGGWRTNLAKELKAAGFEIDWEKVV